LEKAKAGSGMGLIDEKMSAKERDEANEILSEMRDHVGAIDHESEVLSV